MKVQMLINAIWGGSYTDQRKLALHYKVTLERYH